MPASQARVGNLARQPKSWEFSSLLGRPSCIHSFLPRCRGFLTQTLHFADIFNRFSVSSPHPKLPVQDFYSSISTIQPQRLHLDSYLVSFKRRRVCSDSCLMSSFSHGNLTTTRCHLRFELSLSRLSVAFQQLDEGKADSGSTEPIARGPENLCNAILKLWCVEVHRTGWNRVANIPLDSRKRQDHSQEEG